MNEVERQAKLFSNFLCHAHLLLYTPTNTLPHTLPHSHTQTHTHTLPPILSLTTDFFLFTVSVLYTNTHCQCILPAHVLAHTHTYTHSHAANTHSHAPQTSFYSQSLSYTKTHSHTHSMHPSNTHTCSQSLTHALPFLLLRDNHLKAGKF